MINRPRDPRPAIIDLYSGVGGMSLGAYRAGFRVAAAIDNDAISQSTHLQNFPETSHICEDISTLSGSSILDRCGLGKNFVSGVVGGPPCQGFSSMGRQDLKDPRSQLFMHFFRLVSELKPAFFVAENVPNILADKFRPVVSSAIKLISKDYILLPPFPLCASAAGAATRRERIFFIGFDPRKFKTPLSKDDFIRIKNKTVSTFVEAALRGLPKKISSSWQTEELGYQPVTELPSMPFYDQVHGNIPDGVGCQKTIDKLYTHGLVGGCLGTRHNPKVIGRFASLPPGTRDPISKALRLHPAGYCPTIRAGTNRDRGSFQALRPIHYSEPRVITPREAARLQGFPDWFCFHPTKWNSFRQIGNSVSPLVAERIFSTIKEQL